MAIDFGPERWDRVREDYGAWWEGRLERPLIHLTLPGKDPGRDKPDVPLLSQATCADLSIPAEDVIDRIDYELSGEVYLADAFPYVSLVSFGPGVAAAFLGARLDNSTGRVWFFPSEEKELADVHLEYDPDNVWLRRIRDLCEAGMKRWQGQVLMAVPDLGGNLDIVHSFRPGELLAYDVMEHPEEVKRVLWEAHELWHRFYEEINGILAPTNPGFADWSSIYCEDPHYILQCDFSYMIGPDMFEEFVLPELSASCRRLKRSTYHLDGVGQLAHLDHVLSIPELDALQWVPGTGKPPQHEWPEVYRKVHEAGKKQVVFDGFESMATITGMLGSAKGFYHMKRVGLAGDVDDCRRRLAAFGVEA